DGAVGDHFIGIHVGLGARARLPDNQWEMIVELAVDHFLGGSDNGLANLLVQAAQRHVGFGGRALDDTQCAYDRLGLFFPADLEIAQRALGLRPPIAVIVNFNRPESVCFGAGLGHDGDLGRYFLRKESRLTTSPGPAFSATGAGCTASGASSSTVG